MRGLSYGEKLVPIDSPLLFLSNFASSQVRFLSLIETSTFLRRVSETVSLSLVAYLLKVVGNAVREKKTETKAMAPAPSKFSSV